VPDVFTECYYEEGEFGDEASGIQGEEINGINFISYKIKQRNLGVKENCALKKLYVRVWIEFIFLRVESDSGFI